MYKKHYKGLDQGYNKAGVGMTDYLLEIPGFYLDRDDFKAEYRDVPRGKCRGGGAHQVSSSTDYCASGSAKAFDPHDRR